MQSKKIKHFFSGRGGSAEKVADETMAELEELNIFFQDELEGFGKHIIVLGDKGKGGWTPAKVSAITKWFSTVYIGTLCRNNKVDCICTVDGTSKLYTITPQGVMDLYQKYLKKLER